MCIDLYNFCIKMNFFGEGCYICKIGDCVLVLCFGGLYVIYIEFFCCDDKICLCFNVVLSVFVDCDCEFYFLVFFRIWNNVWVILMIIWLEVGLC